MPVEAPGIRPAPLESARFGVKTARADGMTAAALGAALDYCQAGGVQLLIARCPVEDLMATHAFGAAGFELMDTLVYYERDLVGSPVTGGSPAQFALLQADDIDPVEAIARECFRNYGGHYHADSRLDRDACTEVYASWARSCCEQKDPAGFVLVVREAGRTVGFSAFRRNDESEGELLLGAVLPAARGAGLYRRLTTEGMARLQSSGATRFLTSTQLGNWSAQASWTAAGLRPFRAFHTFHRWFDWA
ncbi:MAG TPA: GNAT family N-acetyltransferase [Candidatus Dormibacteraeota bacterium]|jgi:ribosomal protein S18 acetylase RimI-like enzyme